MARRAVVPNAENCSEKELLVAARAASTEREHMRLMAMRALLLGTPQAQVAELYGVTRRSLRGWVHRFNASGIDGLLAGRRSGRPRKIPPEASDRCRELVDHPEQAGESHWTAVKFHGYLREALDLAVGYRTVVRWLHEQGYRLKVPQPWPDRQDEALRELFVERVQRWLADETVELWYLDEMGVEGDPRPRRRWARRGDKPRVPYRGEHIRMSVIGMICPRTGECYTLEVTHTNSDVFQAFLDQANRDMSPERPTNLLICDNASWHKKKTLQWGRFQPEYLPPYSPDLNPIERLWLLIKAEWFSDFIAKDRAALVARLDRALTWAMDRKQDNRRTCSI